MKVSYSAFGNRLKKKAKIARTASKNLLLPLFLLFSFSLFAQQPKVTATIDSSNIQIGEQIKYSIQVETDSTDMVVFPENSFSPLEVVESLKTDTTRNEDRFKLLKEYALTQFDSGRYMIPAQKVLINEKQFLTDSIPVEVATVEVDTTKQKMYSIKPSVEVPPKFEFPVWVWWLLAAIVIIGGLLFYFLRKKKKAEAEKELPPYEQAMEELHKLDDSTLLEKREIKEYYSRLTNSVRRYLDRKIYDRAMESTTSELITYLELKKEAGELQLQENTIQELKIILQRADLAKFANSRPDVITAKGDRSKTENVINEVKESVPEPTEEELLQNEVSLREKARKRKQKRLIIGVVAGLLVVLVAIGALVADRGWTDFKDSVLGHPTKTLLEGDWIRSEYGSPAVTVTTPEVLKRSEVGPTPEVEKALPGRETFSYGSLGSNFYTAINTVELGQNAKVDLDKAVDGIYDWLEQQGAKNIILKQEKFTTVNGAEGIKAYGSLEIENPVTGRTQQDEYMILNFAENGGFEQITVIYSDSDRYADEIAQRIVNSVELKNIEN